MEIFSPIRIGGVEIRNRMVVASMVTNYIGSDGMATERFIAYHERKARGGFGLILPENYVVTENAGGFKGLPGLWRDEQIESHRKLTKRVHAAGAKIFCQLCHAGRETTSAVTSVQCVAPSPIPDPLMGEVPHELTIPEILEIEERFAQAARRAKEAGFDGVELHGAHGYLIGEFNSPFSNKRVDRYGGTPYNRCRFLLEIIARVRAKVGRDYPIQLRMSANEFVDGGLGIEDSKLIAMLVEQAGVDSFHVSQGIYASANFITPPSCIPHGAFTDHAAAIKSVVKVPVITVGRINDPLIAETIIRSGKADLCSMARASLADADMPKKAMEGRWDEINHCLGCMQGCTAEESKGMPVRCLVDPMTGMETVYKPEPAAVSKRIVVVGGGVAGCEAAIAAARRGHHVTILEKTGELGGQWLAAAVPIGKADFTAFVAWQKVMIEKLGISIVYNCNADRVEIERYTPDAVILAYGSYLFVPPVPGLRQHGVSAEDVLRGRVVCGRKTVVIGGGLVGAETADHLSAHGAAEVSIIEMMPEIVKDGEEAPVFFLKQRLKEKNVYIYTSATVSEVTNTTVSFTRNGETITLTDINTVVIATGRRADPALSDSLRGADFDVITVGDALCAKNGYLNIREGYEAGLKV